MCQYLCAYKKVILKVVWQALEQIIKDLEELAAKGGVSGGNLVLILIVRKAAAFAKAGP